MSIFGTIMSKVFGSGHPAATEAAPATPTPAGAAPATPTPTGAAPASPEAAPAAGSPAATPAHAAEPVDVASVLDGMEGEAGQELDWRHSIVDLMKLLHMDSSLTARKQLASELHYTGDTSDSATMNMWLHKEVMAKFAANGGKLPADMAH